MTANTTRNRNHTRLTAAVLATIVGSSAFAQSTWTGATGGEWGDAANWTVGVPNAIDAVANINTALTVNLSDTGTAGTYPYTVGTLASNIATGSVVLGNNSVVTDILRLEVASGTPTVNVATSNTNIFVYANFEGTQGFNKTGSGKLTFRFNGADQTYSGPITISGGVLGINQNGSLGNDDNDITIANGARLLAEPGSNSGTITLPASRTITLTGAQSQIGSNNAAVNLVINGTITGGPTAGLVKTDAGVVTLNGASSWGGETRVVGGVLDLDAGVGAFVQGGNVLVQGGSGTSLDMRDLPSFTMMSATPGTFIVNPVTTADGSSAYTITSFVSATNNNITASTVRIGGASGSSTGPSHTAVLRLGQTNVMNTGTFQLGGFNGQGIVNFQSGLTNPSLKVRGVDGVAALPEWKIGETSSGVRTGGGTIDLNGGSLDAVVDTITISRHIAGANVGSTSRLIMSDGVLTATTVELGVKQSTGTPTLEAILTQGGGSVQARTINMGTNLGSDAVVFRPSYNLNGGTLAAETITVPAGAFGATSSRNINLNGGTLKNYDAATDLVVNGIDGTAGGVINIVVGESGGTIAADAGRAVSLGVNTAVSGAGTLTKSGAGRLNINGTAAAPITVAAGALGGTGTLSGAVNVQAGKLSPGQSIGTLTIDNTVQFSATAALAVEIESASSFDRLVVNDAKSLGGSMEINLLAGYNPLPADSFTVISGTGAVSGSFSTNPWGLITVLGGGKAFLPQYGATDVVLTDFARVGDVNRDGAVNNLDIASFVGLLTGNPAAGSVGFAGDVNGDGVVNNLDIAPFVALLTGGRPVGDDPEFAPLLSLVPEPASLSLLALGGLTLGRRRRA